MTSSNISIALMFIYCVIAQLCVIYAQRDMNRAEHKKRLAEIDRDYYKNMSEIHKTHATKLEQHLLGTAKPTTPKKEIN